MDPVTSPSMVASHFGGWYQTIPVPLVKADTPTQPKPALCGRVPASHPHKVVQGWTQRCRHIRSSIRSPSGEQQGQRRSRGAQPRQCAANVPRGLAHRVINMGLQGEISFTQRKPSRSGLLCPPRGHPGASRCGEEEEGANPFITGQAPSCLLYDGGETNPSEHRNRALEPPLLPPLPALLPQPQIFSFNAPQGSAGHQSPELMFWHLAHEQVTVVRPPPLTWGRAPAASWPCSCHRGCF